MPAAYRVPLARVEVALALARGDDEEALVLASAALDAAQPLGVALTWTALEAWVQATGDSAPGAARARLEQGLRGLPPVRLLLALTELQRRQGDLAAAAWNGGARGVGVPGARGSAPGGPRRWRRWAWSAASARRPRGSTRARRRTRTAGGRRG
ncbi:MAG: hypothetical protein R3F59_19200 [Myxococcota bacterium]